MDWRTFIQQMMGGSANAAPIEPAPPPTAQPGVSQSSVMNLSGLGSGQQERAAYKPPAWIDSAPEMRRLGPAYAKQESQVDAKLMESIQKQQGIGAKPLLPQEPPGAQTTGYGAVPKQASADLTGM